MPETTRLFDTLATNYAQRPDYPPAILEWLREFAQPLPEGDVVDIGTGTGILLRQMTTMLGAGRRYVGIEPNRAMLAQARAAPVGNADVDFIEAPAEAVPLAEACAALLTVAQALHWFDRTRFYAEAQRLAAPGATLAVLYNRRDPDDAMMAAYQDLIGAHMSRDGDAGTGSARGGLGMALMADGTFRRELEVLPRATGVREVHHRWTRSMRRADFITMCFSTVNMVNVVKALGDAAARDQLLAILAEHAPSATTISVPYVTSLIVVRL